jgi:hypothetical protein
MSAPGPTTAVVKIYFDIKDEHIGLYRSLRVQEQTTFGDLHARVSDRIGVSRARSVFFHLALRYTSPVMHPRVDGIPPHSQRVLEVIAHEEAAWTGDIMLVFIDSRRPGKRLVETGSANAEIQRQAGAGAGGGGQPAPMTEFFHHSDGTEKFTVVAESIMTEVENVCIKSGKLHKMQMGKESVWKEVTVHLDQTRLWISKGQESDHALGFIELAEEDTVKYIDENAYTFAVRNVHGSSTALRAKSRSEMSYWKSAIETRASSVSENGLIAMAESHIGQHEFDRVEDNFRSLSSLSEFRGALCNRYMRRKFRKYLENNDEDQLLRFWEYAEDYKLCHAATHRFDGQHDLGPGDASPGGGTPGLATNQKMWPDNYRYSAHESRRFASFISASFLSPEAGGSRSRVALPGISEADLALVRELLPRAPRTLFVSIQRVVMRELLTLFYEDFARAQRYRDYLLDASLDLLGCYETECAAMGPLAQANPNAPDPCPLSPFGSAVSGMSGRRDPKTPATGGARGRGRTSSFNLPFQLFRSRSNSESVAAGGFRFIPLRKAVSLDNPATPQQGKGQGQGQEGASPFISPFPALHSPTASVPAVGIAFGTPLKDGPSSPMSFVFTPSPQSAEGISKHQQAPSPPPAVAAKDAAKDVPVAAVPEKKGWFSNLRIFKKGDTATTPTAAPSPASAPSTPIERGARPAACPGDESPFLHPSWAQPRDGDEPLWLSDGWWQGKAPGMERYLAAIAADTNTSTTTSAIASTATSASTSTTAATATNSSDASTLAIATAMTAYRSYAQWAPGPRMDQVLRSIRTVSVSESVLMRLDPPPGAGAGAGAGGGLSPPPQASLALEGGQGQGGYQLSPLREVPREEEEEGSKAASGAAAFAHRAGSSSSFTKDKDHKDGHPKHVIVWNSGKGKEGGKTRQSRAHSHHAPEEYRRTGDASHPPTPEPTPQPTPEPTPTQRQRDFLLMVSPSVFDETALASLPPDLSSSADAVADAAADADVLIPEQAPEVVPETVPQPAAVPALAPAAVVGVEPGAVASTVTVTKKTEKSEKSSDVEDKGKGQEQYYVPIGLYQPRRAHGSSVGSMASVGGPLSRPLAAAPYSLVFAPEVKLTARGVPVGWSPDGTAGLAGAEGEGEWEGERRSSDLGSVTGSGIAGLCTPVPMPPPRPSSTFDSPDRVTMGRNTLTGPAPSGSKGRNIFMNRRAETHARMGVRSRQTELDAGRLKGEARGLRVGAAHPLPPYLGGYRGQILLWAHVKARCGLCCAVLCCAVVCCGVVCCGVLCCAMLCCAMICYAMICYDMLCYAMLCYAVLCCAMLCCAMICCAMMCYAML